MGRKMALILTLNNIESIALKTSLQKAMHTSYYNNRSSTTSSPPCERLSFSFTTNHFKVGTVQKWQIRRGEKKKGNAGKLSKG